MLFIASLISVGGNFPRLQQPSYLPCVTHCITGWKGRRCIHFITSFCCLSFPRSLCLVFSFFRLFFFVICTFFSSVLSSWPCSLLFLLYFLGYCPLLWFSPSFPFLVFSFFPLFLIVVYTFFLMFFPLCPVLFVSFIFLIIFLFLNSHFHLLSFVFFHFCVIFTFFSSIFWPRASPAIFLFIFFLTYIFSPASLVPFLVSFSLFSSLFFTYPFCPAVFLSSSFPHNEFFIYTLCLILESCTFVFFPLQIVLSLLLSNIASHIFLPSFHRWLI